MRLRNITAIALSTMSGPRRQSYDRRRSSVGEFLKSVNALTYATASLIILADSEDRKGYKGRNTRLPGVRAPNRK